jgi:hypothetical protein
MSLQAAVVEPGSLGDQQNQQIECLMAFVALLVYCICCIYSFMQVCMWSSLCASNLLAAALGVYLLPASVRTSMPKHVCGCGCDNIGCVCADLQLHLCLVGQHNCSTAFSRTSADGFQL